jgi:hypothetical protein
MNKKALSYSTRLPRKGALVEESYRVFACWEPEESVAANLKRIRATNPFGAKNESWLREVTMTMSGRFGHGDSLTPLVSLAKAQYPVERWKFCLLWHVGSTDGLFRLFMEEFLFEEYSKSIAAFDTASILPFVDHVNRAKLLQTPLTPNGRIKLAQDLLRMARAFGLLGGKTVRKFTHVAIPDDALLYALYSLQAEIPSVSRALQSPRWRLFLLAPAAIERELLNLHQLRRLRYEQAGSIRELSLPHASLLEFAQSLTS